MIDNNITTSGNLNGTKLKAGEKIKLQKGNRVIERSANDYFSNTSTWEKRGFKLYTEKAKVVKEVKAVKKEVKKEVKKDTE